VTKPEHARLDGIIEAVFKIVEGYLIDAPAIELAGYNSAKFGSIGANLHFYR